MLPFPTLSLSHSSPLSLLPSLPHSLALSPSPSLISGPYWSLMFEVSENKQYKPVNLDTIVEVRSSSEHTFTVIQIVR